MWRFGLILGFSVVLAGCGRSGEGDARAELMVYAAASLGEVIRELGVAFEARTGVTVQYNLAGSGTLAQQLLAAPRADVFVSASQGWIEAVADAGLLTDPAPRQVAGNALAVVVARESEVALTGAGDLLAAEVRLVAVGDPAYVPAGRYAREWLESRPSGQGSSVWAELQGRLSLGSDVRAVAAQAASRRDVAGIVYATDYRAMQGQLRLAFEVPAEDGPAIGYWAAALAGAMPRGEAFVLFLVSEPAREIWLAHGFLVGERQ